MGLLKTLGVLPVVVAVLSGMAAGMSAFTFSYGDGHSYFSEDPKACINCHIMEDHYDSWINSSHSDVATCNDCHLPNDQPMQLISKADNGFFHSWGFTFQDFHEPIRIKPRNRRIVQNNCVDCHQDLVHEMLPSAVRGETISCIECHANVGHAASR